MKVLIPILHCIFTAAQLWGEKCTWDLWQQEKRKAKASLEDGTETKKTDLDAVSTGSKSVNVQEASVLT